MTVWSDWSDWTQCSVFCGDGAKSRNRTCIIGEDSDPCTGNSSETVTCKNRECPGKVILYPFWSKASTHYALLDIWTHLHIRVKQTHNWYLNMFIFTEEICTMMCLSYTLYI